MGCENVNEEVESSSEFHFEIARTIRIADDWLGTFLRTNAPIRLPIMMLKCFHDNPLEWHSFWDLFETSIHYLSDNSEPDKFYYLLSQPEGEAALLLSEFEQTKENYQEAVELLKSTYSKKK